MKVGEFCNRETVICDRDTTLPEVARLMRRNHVGDVIITERQHGQLIPVGILTDRDIVIELVAEEVDLEAVTAGDVMSYDLHTAKSDDDLLDTIKRMRSRAIRRLPVISQTGSLIGILAVDDLLELLAEQLDDLVNLVTSQSQREAERRT